MNKKGVAELIRREYAERYIEKYEKSKASEDGRTIRYTASFGVYEFTADASDLDHGIRQVDEMLYRAKQNGRNRVEYNGDIKY